MAITLANVGIAVRDIDATISFFTDLGLELVGRDTISGDWADTAVGLDGNRTKIAILRTPDGHGEIELFEYLHPDAIETEPTLPNQIVMHRVAFSVDDIDAALEIAARHDCYPLRGVATYLDVYTLTYLRGPSGIIVMLAEALRKNCRRSADRRQPNNIHGPFSICRSLVARPARGSEGLHDQRHCSSGSSYHDAGRPGSPQIVILAVSPTHRSE